MTTRALLVLALIGSLGGAVACGPAEQEIEESEQDERSVFESSDIYWIDENLNKEGNFDRIHRLPIQADPEGAREVINTWVEERSYLMLPEFEDEGTIDFEADSGSVELPAFGAQFETRASADEEVTVVRAPYTANYELWLMMPEGDLGAFVDGLDPERFQELRWGASRHDVTLTLPKFQTTSNPDIIKAIEQMREDTGTTGGTLSGACRETYVHKAVIKADEEGTSASAASAVVEYENGDPGLADPLTVNLDRPFFYAVLDPNTGSILFMGEYTGD